jgi:chromosome segregation ATPase
MFWCQATAFAERIASGALTSEFAIERRRLEGRIERLRTQHTEAVKEHTEAVKDKSAAENKSRNLLEKLSATEKEREDLNRRLVKEKEGTERARAKAQAARAEADAARAEADIALKRVADKELELKSLRNYPEKMEASTRTGVERAHTLFVKSYRELGAQTTPFDRSGEEVGLRFLGWLQ